VLKHFQTELLQARDRVLSLDRERLLLYVLFFIFLEEAEAAHHHKVDQGVTQNTFDLIQQECEEECQEHQSCVTTEQKRLRKVSRLAD
jgi:hypothetical protein